MQRVFSEGELALDRRTRRIKEVSQGEAAFQGRLVAAFVGCRAMQVPVFLLGSPCKGLCFTCLSTSSAEARLCASRSL